MKKKTTSLQYFNWNKTTVLWIWICCMDTTFTVWEVSKFEKKINKLKCKVLPFTNVHIHITFQVLVYIIAYSRI